MNHMKYINKHRLIKLFGISDGMLLATIGEKNVTSHIFEADCVDWMSSTKFSNSTGTYHLSTTEEKYHCTLQWVDQILLPMVSNIPGQKPPPKYTGTSPSRNPTRLRNPFSNYNEKIASASELLHDDISTSSHNAWHKPLKIVLTTSTNTVRTNDSNTSQTDISNPSTTNTQIIQLLTSLQQNLKSSIETQQNNIDKLITSLPTMFETFLDQKLQSLQEDINHLQNKIKEMEAATKPSEKPAPGSGNSRARKLPRPTPPDLSTVNKKLITTFFPRPQSHLDTLTNESPSE